MNRGAGLRVAYDATPLIDLQTGVGRYARELAAALELRGISLKRYATALKGSGAPEVARSRAPARLTQLAWRRLGWPPIERLTGPVDVVHGTNFVLPPARHAAGVVTVHDLSFYRDDTFPGGDRLRVLVPWSVARSARVVVPSRAVADEVAERFGLSDGRIQVTHEGVSPVFFGATPLGEGALAQMGIRPPFALAAGTLAPRKNLELLLESWRRVGTELAGLTLVIAGPRGWGRRLREAPGVVLTGWIGDQTLPGLLAAAEFFCFPSLYEGFGLPPLEAMAAGTPVIAGSYSCASEILGEAALMVDAKDPDALASALRQMASDSGLRDRLRIAGRVHASRFTWEQTAAKTIAAYESAAAENGS